MGRIFLKRGRYHLDYLDETGSRRRCATPYGEGDKELAHETLRQAEAGIDVRKRAMDEGGPMTLRAWAARWIASRKAADGSWVNQEGQLRLHILPVLGDMLLTDIKPRHIIGWLEGMKQKKLSPWRLRGCYSTLKVAYKDAIVQEVVSFSPCVLTKRDLPRNADKDPAWRATAIFTRDEAELLMSDERIAEDRKVQHALLFLAGLRFGELSALQWSDYDPRAEPLGRLSIERSYDQRLHRLKPTKTECPRAVPVHPELAKILAEWKLSGFERYVGRSPKPGDLILPASSSRHCDVHRLAGTEWRSMLVEFEMLGLRHRRQHDARRTFISLALADGAPPHVLKWISHGSKSSVMDQYTTLPWSTLCSAVSCLKLKRHEGQVVRIAKFASGTTLAPSEETSIISNDYKEVCYSLLELNSSTYANRSEPGRTVLDGSHRTQRPRETTGDPAMVPNGAKAGDPVGDTLLKILAEWQERRDPLHLRASIRALAKVLRNKH